VADEDHRSVVAVEGLDEGLAALEVEVVGGLVEEEQVARLQQQAGQGDASTLAAAQHPDVLVDVVAAEQEGAQDRAHAGHSDLAVDAEDLVDDRVLGSQEVQSRAGRSSRG
jgi:hypothetical protein